MEELINKVSLEVINFMVGEPLEWADGYEDSHWMLQLTIGFIKGVQTLAEALKEEIKKNGTEITERPYMVTEDGTTAHYGG